MDDFEDRARRAGDALNDSVIDLEPADAAPPPPRSRRGVGVALVVVVGLIAAGVVVSQRDEPDNSLQADVPVSTTEPTTTEPTPAALPRYLPRWLPADLAPSTGTVAVVGCGATSTGSPSSTTTVSLPAGVHSANLSGATGYTEFTAIAASSDAGGCQASWSAVFAGPAAAGPRVVFLHGGRTPNVPSGAETVTVRGRETSLSSPSSASPAAWLALSWSEDDIALTMTGIGLARDELLKVAESVERVSDDEWNEVVKPRQSPTMPPSMMRPDLTTATELARLTTPDGQLVRLLAGADGSSVCISSGNSLGCTGALPILTSPRITTMMGTNGLISLPAGLPADVTLRRTSGETLPSARSSDGRYLLIAGTSLGTDYKLVDSTGQVVATVKGFPCPQLAASAAASTLCAAPATTPPN